MFKQTLRNQVLYTRRFVLALLVFVSVFSLFFANLYTPKTAYAAAADTVNFQARLQTASGAIVPDGYYNIEFKLYSAATGGSALWTEDYTNTSGPSSSDVRIAVRDGYLSTALGSITTFPSTIDWSQQMYLTMNIGGTGTSPSWDGEMNPRLALTATPYAFLAQRASQSDELSTTNTNGTDTLSVQAPGSGLGDGSQTFILQDQGTAGTYYLLAANSSGNVAVSGQASAASVDTSSVDTSSAGSISIGSTNATAVNVGNSTSNVATTINGTMVVKPTTGHDTTTAFQVQPAGSSTPVLNVDTTNMQVDIGTASGQGTLTVQGATSDSSGNGLVINDSIGNSLLQVRNDGLLTLGDNANNVSEEIGHNSIGANSDNGFEQLVIASKITTGSLVPTLTSISAYVQGTDASPNNKYVVGIYADSSGSPGSLIAVSSSGTLTAGAWNTLSISASLSADTTYWLAFSTNTTSNTTNFVPYDTGGSDTHAYMGGYANAGTSLPSTFTAAGTGGVLDSIYANVLVSGSPVATTLTVSPTDGVNVTTPSNTSTALQVQNATGAALFDVDTSGSSVDIGATGSTAVASTVNIADSSSTGNVQTVTIGSSVNTGDAVTLNAGSSSVAITNTGLNFQANNQNNSNVYLFQGNGSVTSAGSVGTFFANTTSSQTALDAVSLLGQSSSTSTFAVQSNSSGTYTNMFTVGATGQVIAKNLSNMGNAFQVMDTSNTPVINVDTTQDQVTLNGTGHNNLVLNVLTSSEENGIIFNYTGASGPSGEIGFAGDYGQIINQTAQNDLAIRSSSGNIYLAAGGSNEEVKIDTNGNTTFKNLSDSTTNSFQVQNATAINILSVNTSNKLVNVGATGSDALATTVNIATSNGASQAVNIGNSSSEVSTITVGSTGSTSATTIQGGSGGIILSAGQVAIGTGSTGESTAKLLVLDNQSSGGTNPGEVNGAMFYNVGTHSFTCGIAGAWEACDGLLYSNASVGSAVNNCLTTACSSVGSAPIPANYCQQGRVIRILAQGTWADTSVAPTLGFSVRYGTSATQTSDILIGSATPAVQGTSTSSSGMAWNLDLTIICFSTTSMNIGGTYTLQPSTTTTAANTVTSLVPITQTGLTTTSAQNLYIFPQIGTQDASNSVTLSQLVVSGS